MGIFCGCTFPSKSGSVFQPHRTSPTSIHQRLQRHDFPGSSSRELLEGAPLQSRCAGQLVRSVCACSKIASDLVKSLRMQMVNFRFGAAALTFLRLLQNFRGPRSGSRVVSRKVRQVACTPPQRSSTKYAPFVVPYYDLLISPKKVQCPTIACMTNGRILPEANHADLRQSGTSPANRVPMVGDLLSGPIFQISLLLLSVNRRRLLVRLPTSL